MCHEIINKEVTQLSKQEVETKRLRLIPLKIQELELSVEDYGKMQASLGLKVNNRTLDEEMIYAMRIRLKKVLEDVDNFMWLTNWAVVSKENNEIIGFFILKGYPNEIGEVIVGYGIDEKYRRKGFATEVLKGLSDWIFLNPKALSVIADTEKTNLPSHKVLINVGATKYKETDELIWWRLEKRK